MTEHSNRQANDRQSSRAANRTSIRHPVPTRRIATLTAETRVNRVQAATYHNYVEQWVKVQSLYQCDCGRHIGFQIQEPLVAQPPVRIDEEVISVHSTPPKRSDLNISISSSEGSVVIIEDSADPQGLLQERVGYIPPEPESSDLRSITPNTVVASDKSSESPDEPMC